MTTIVNGYMLEYAVILIEREKMAHLTRFCAAKMFISISVNIRTPNHTGIVLLRSFRLTREHMATEISCTVCENMFKVGQTVVILPCGHLFHKSCILLRLSRTVSVHETCSCLAQNKQ